MSHRRTASGGSARSKPGRFVAASVHNPLPSACLQLMPLAAAQTEGHLLPSLCSLLSTPSCSVLFAYWLDCQTLGTFHTVELASHLACLSPRNPPSASYACDLYQAYCTSESPYPVACEVRPATLEKLFQVLEQAQQGQGPQAATATGTAAGTEAGTGAAEIHLLDGHLFAPLLDELAVFLLPHFNYYLHSSDWTYASLDRVLLSSTPGPAELLFSVAKNLDVEEVPLFVLDFHALLRRMYSCPPRLLAGIKLREEERAAKRGAGATAATSHAALAAALEDGFELDSSNEGSWVLSARHQRLLDEGLLPRDAALIMPRPPLPSGAAGVAAVPAANQEARTLHVPTFVSARLAEVVTLFECYLQPSSAAARHMHHSALLSLQPRLGAAGGGLGLRSGTQMSAPHPASRRSAEFALRDLPVYLLRNFLDVLHLCTRFEYVSSELMQALWDIKNWSTRDLVLRRGVGVAYAEAKHFGLGRGMGLAKGVKDERGRERKKRRRKAALQAAAAASSDASSSSAAAAAAPPSTPLSEPWFRLGEFEPPERARSPSPLPDASVLAALEVSFHPPARRRARSDAEAAPLAAFWTSMGLAGGGEEAVAGPALVAPAPRTLATVGPLSSVSEVYESARRSLLLISSHARTPPLPALSSHGAVGGGAEDASAASLPTGAMRPPLLLTASPMRSPRTLARGASPGGSSALSAFAPPSPSFGAQAGGGLVAPSPLPAPALLPALPFLPPQRSFQFGSVSLYRKHVLGERRRHDAKEEAEEENLAKARGALAAGGSSSSAGMGVGTKRGLTASSPAAAAAAAAAKDRAAQNPSPLLRASSTSASSTTSPSPTRRALTRRPLRPSPPQRPPSLDELDAVACALRISLEPLSPGEGRARVRQLHEQMQSMRHLLAAGDDPAAPSTPPQSQPQGISASAPPSPTHSHGMELPDLGRAHSNPTSPQASASAAFTPSSFLLSPAAHARAHSSSLNGHSFGHGHAHLLLIPSAAASGTPRSGARRSVVRFSALQRHEVREFDAADALRSSGAPSPSAAAATAASAAGSSLSSTGGRSILKQAPSSLAVPAGLSLGVVGGGGAAGGEENGHGSSETSSKFPRPDSTSPPAPFPVSAAVPVSFMGHRSSLQLQPPSASYSELMRRIYDQRQAETARLMAILQQGAVFLKFQSGAGLAAAPPPPPPQPQPPAPPASSTAAAATGTNGASGSATSSGTGVGGTMSGNGTSVVSAAAPPFPRCAHRFFYVSADMSEVSWTKLVNTRKEHEPNGIILGGQRKKPQKAGVFHKHKNKLLADGLRLFPDSFHSSNFASYNAAASPPWLCLTLLFPDRSLDLVALSDAQAADWFFGLQALVPLNPSFKSAPLYRWHRLRLKVQYYAKAKGLSVARYCRILVNTARIRIEEEKRSSASTAGASAGAGAGAASEDASQEEAGEASASRKRAATDTATMEALAAANANLESPSPLARQRRAR